MDNSGGIQGNITAGLAGRYASALFDLARESNAIDSVKKSLADLKAGLAESADLSALIASPVIGRTEAARAIEAVAQATCPPSELPASTKRCTPSWSITAVTKRT